MATILLQAAGAYIGGLLGPIGATIGTAAGAVAGYMLDRALIAGTQRIEGPRLTGARPFTAEEGVSLPRIYGTARLGGTLIWATRFQEVSETSRQGKFGPKVTEYSYFANAAFSLCEGKVAGIRRAWADGKELDLTTIELRVYNGAEDQLADPLIEAKQGAGNTPAYRGTAYVVVDNLDIGPFGNRLPQLQFEVLRPLGTVPGKIKAVCLIPGATEYGLATSVVEKEIRPGESEAVNRHVLHAGSDIAASLDELQMLCPELEHVALVVSWFGNDLRAGECRIRPAVTTRSGGMSEAWHVAGLGRATADLISTHDGGPAYGGTPSDQSVKQAIAEIRSRGLKVTFYPFIMMDVPADTTLPDPYGGGAQPAYPWRGRITCDPAPLQPGSTDKTALAREQIEAFCGSGSGDWGYRRFVLHNAHLAEAAGGVDAFLIGTELRGLTTLRDETGAFPSWRRCARWRMTCAGFWARRPS
nr:glycoside hydrolase TIM-barrel-like domain-containing protein [Oryzicola mucosus]